ncbi:MAG: hypothetical protein GC191_10165 [Azospirillum sp.]|nr:hypothetical protein [Azospirillum sp.]
MIAGTEYPCGQFFAGLIDQNDSRIRHRITLSGGVPGTDHPAGRPWRATAPFVGDNHLYCRDLGLDCRQLGRGFEVAGRVGYGLPPQFDELGE